MSDQPKKRPWFQFHLSTAIVLMFVAGGLLWANTASHGHFFLRNGSWWYSSAWGWPFHHYEAVMSYDHHLDPTRYTEGWTLARVAALDHSGWSAAGAACNVCVALAVLFGVAVICERPDVRGKPRKRRWFQLHLSTAVMLVLVAAVLLSLNMHGVREDFDKRGVLSSWGWPLPLHELFYRSREGQPFRPDVVHVLVDVAVALSLLSVAIVSEWRIRRRERRP